MTFRLHHCSAAVLSASVLFTGVVAQTPGTPERIAAMKQALAANQAALRQYSWVEATTVTLKGEVKKQEQKQCYYGVDGKVQKTPIPGATPPAGGRQSGGGRRGRVAERIVENKVDETQEYMEKVAALVHQYVPPDPQKIQAAQAAGNVSVDASKLTVKNYLKPGDVLALAFDAAAKKLTSYSANSYVEKPKDDDVTLSVTFGALPDGTSYPQQVVLDVKAKNIQVKVANSGYKKTAP